MKQNPSKSIDKQLRQAIADSGMSVNQLAQLSGVPQPTIQRFYSGTRDIYLASAARLATFFGMTLTAPKTIQDHRRAENSNAMSGKKARSVTGNKRSRRE